MPISNQLPGIDPTSPHFFWLDMNKPFVSTSEGSCEICGQTGRWGDVNHLGEAVKASAGGAG